MAIIRKNMKNKKRPKNDSELPVFDRTFPIVYSPHKEKICGSEAVRIYAKGMNLITDGFIKEGKALLEDSYRRGYLTAGNTLSYGYSAGWFGERDYAKHIQLLRQLVRK